MFENMKNLTDAFSKMGSMRKELKDIQKRIASLRVSADSGAGMVTVTCTGDGIITNVKINKAMFDSDDSEMLEDLIISATNSAIKKAKDAMEHEIKSATGGLDLSQISKMFDGK